VSCPLCRGEEKVSCCLCGNSPKDIRQTLPECESFQRWLESLGFACATDGDLRGTGFGICGNCRKNKLRTIADSLIRMTQNLAKVGKQWLYPAACGRRLSSDFNSAASATSPFATPASRASSTRSTPGTRSTGSRSASLSSGKNQNTSSVLVSTPSTNSTGTRSVSSSGKVPKARLASERTPVKAVEERKRQVRRLSSPTKSLVRSSRANSKSLQQNNTPVVEDDPTKEDFDNQPLLNFLSVYHFLKHRAREILIDQNTVTGTRLINQNHVHPFIRVGIKPVRVRLKIITSFTTGSVTAVVVIVR
jgi:hypothetical protein